MTFEATGIDELIDALNKLDKETEPIAAQALYDGAGVMAAAIRSQVNSIPTEDWHYVDERHPHKMKSATTQEKNAIAQVIGISEFDKNGSEVNTSIGINDGGYMKVKNPYSGVEKEVPIIKVARSVNSGSSVREKYPFARKAKAAAKSAAEQATVAKGEKLIKEITGE